MTYWPDGCAELDPQTHFRGVNSAGVMLRTGSGATREPTLLDGIARPDSLSPPKPEKKAEKLRCRLIDGGDLEAVIDLFGRGFPERKATYWKRGFEHHALRPLPADCPRYGYIMEIGGRVVGVVLTLYAVTHDAQGESLRCNLSSWYVEEAYRPYATLLDRVAMKRKDVTFTNISAAPHTVPMHSARGFSCYSKGQVLSFPGLAKGHANVEVRGLNDPEALTMLPPSERTLLKDHAAYGCIGVIGWDDRGAQPFVFRKRPVNAAVRRLGFSPVLYIQLVYCRSTAELPRFARALGVHLFWRHGAICLAFDADQPMAGMPGLYLDGVDMKLKRGPDTIKHGDLAYSEFALFGP